MSDILCVSVEGMRKDKLGEIMESTRRYTAMVMAARVEDPVWFATCREMGFSLFSGSFFKTPDVIKLRKMSSNEVSRFKILRLLEMNEPDFDKLAETIQSDVSISFRLLAYLNSTAFGFPQKIKSIQHAITMLGWNKIKHWLRMVLITDVSQHVDAEDLTLLSAQRGKFLELVATDHDYWGFDPESLHLLGLFSLLDVMLGIPMQDILAHLPLDAKLKSALCGDTNSEYVSLLSLARCFEEARWAEADRMIQQLNLDKTKVGLSFQQSVAWAADLTTMYAG